MLTKRSWTNKDEIYKLADSAATLGLVVAILLLAIYSFAPLFGGKFFLAAVLKLTSWLAITLVLKMALARVRKGLKLRKYHYFLIWACAAFNLCLWFKFPFNVVFVIAAAFFIMHSYKYKLS